MNRPTLMIWILRQMPNNDPNFRYILLVISEDWPGFILAILFGNSFVKLHQCIWFLFCFLPVHKTLVPRAGFKPAITHIGTQQNCP